jgi:hypothetical protein
MPELHSSAPFDFDSWATLARNDPQAFEAKRNNVLETAIRQAPARRRQRLRCLQWKLDQIRLMAPNPMSATVRMHQLMWDSVTGEDGLLARLQQFRNAESPIKKPVRSANILQFPQ